MRLTTKSWRRYLLSLVLLVAMLTSGLYPVPQVHAELTTDFDQLSQAQIVSEIGAGWNLGNTMEAFSDYGPNEEMWGNPKVTKELS